MDRLEFSLKRHSNIYNERPGTTNLNFSREPRREDPGRFPACLKGEILCGTHSIVLFYIKVKYLCSCQESDKNMGHVRTVCIKKVSLRMKTQLV